MSNTSSRDGGKDRESGHRKHRKRKTRTDRHRVAAQHVILRRLVEVGTAWAPDLDGVLPPGPSGNKTYLGTAIVDLRRAGLIATIGGPVATTQGRRHSSFLHRWHLAVEHDAVEAYLAAHPIPDPEPENEDDNLR